MKTSRITTFVLVASIALFAGCTGRNNSADLSDEAVDTTTYDTQNNGQIFDDSSSSAGNLFDTDMSSDPNASLTTSQAQTVYETIPQSASNCLSSNAGLTFDANGYATSNPTCYTTASATATNPYADALHELVYMRACYERVKAYKPDASMAGPANIAKLRLHFKAGKMAITRCFRAHLRETIQRRPWTPTVAYGMQATDRVLQDLLSQIYSGGIN